jgi:peroxiredoxin
MNAPDDPGARVSKTLVVIAAVVAAASIAGAGLYAALGRGGEPPASAPAVASGPGGQATAPVSLKPRAGRALAFDDAVRELDLVRPTRQKLAEDFTLPLAEGTRFRLAEQRGKVVLINFWATWCPPCREEMPALERMWQHHKDQGFVLVAVSLDADPKVVTPYLTRHRLTFPVALDPTMDLGNAYGVRALPSSFVVDRQGYVVALALGPRPWDGDASHSVVESLLK